MTTVINNPGNSGGGESSGVGVIVGIIVAIVVVGLFVVYALPAIRGGQAPTDGSIDVNLKVPGINDAPAAAPQP